MNIPELATTIFGNPRLPRAKEEAFGGDPERPRFGVDGVIGVNGVIGVIGVIGVTGVIGGMFPSTQRNQNANEFTLRGGNNQAFPGDAGYSPRPRKTHAKTPCEGFF